MLLTEMTDIILYEALPGLAKQQQMMPPMIPPKGPGGEISPDGTDETGDPAEFMPLKKYYLIQQLEDLQMRFKENNMTNQDLNIILKFCTELNYKTLLKLTAPFIEMTLAQLNIQQGDKNAKKEK